MELTNLTGLPAQLIRTAIDETRIAAAVVARLSYDIAPNGTLTRRAEQPWIVSRPPWDGPRGPMPSDDVFYRGGVDVFIFGRAWTPRGRPAKASVVRTRVGTTFDSSIFVFGDREWVGSGRYLRPSDPKVFTSIPLTLAHAFGGKVTWDGLDIPFPDNPEGKGFSNEAAQAIGKPLPNLEDPDHLVREWSDTPDPVGVGIRPTAFGPHLRESVVFDDKGIMTKLFPRFFNAAFPKMIVERVAAEDAVVVEGVSPDGPLRFTVPACPLAVDLRVGATRLTRRLAVDQIGIEAEERRVFITYRDPFRYTILARQARSCALRFAEGKG